MLAARDRAAQPPWVSTFHTLRSATQLQQIIAAERLGAPFLVLDEGGPLTLRGERITIGRTERNEIALPQDTEVSRLHAELERIAGEWTVTDDGLSRNGTFVNGRRIAGRTRLRDGDVLQVGRTTLTFRRPEEPEAEHTEIADAPAPVELTPAQARVLAALAAPLRDAEGAMPATNVEIAEQLHLSLDAVKAHLRALFARFGLEDLPQNAKRTRLAAEARRRGLV